MGVHDGHRQRMKEQYLNSGMENLADHQLLELLLFYAIPRRDTNELAHRLIERFGSFQNVFRASSEELASVEGMGVGSAALLRLVKDTSLRLQQAPEPATVLSSTCQAGEFFRDLLRGQKREMIYLACVDAKNKLLTCRCIAKGTVSTSYVEVRQVVEHALYAGASGVFLAHNHPAGVATASASDICNTGEIVRALEPLNIRFLDHFIIANGEYISMKDSGAFAE